MTQVINALTLKTITYQTETGLQTVEIDTIVKVDLNELIAFHDGQHFDVSSDEVQLLLN